MAEVTATVTLSTRQVTAFVSLNTSPVTANIEQVSKVVSCTYSPATKYIYSAEFENRLTNLEEKITEIDENAVRTLKTDW